jgi:glucosamine--fructose-6-phosphate aminotransferase (isomerizing)
LASTVYPKREWIAAGKSYAGQADALVAMVEHLAAQIEKGAPPRPDRLRLVGIGASHAAAAAPAFRLRADGIEAARFLPSELPDDRLDDGAMTVFISQSGRSAEVVSLAARAKGSDAYAVTNYHPSPLGEACARGLNLGNLADSSVSFVTFTGTMLALGLLADHWAGRSEKQKWIDTIGSAYAMVEAADADLRNVVEALVACSGTDFVAPAASVSAAEEAALMWREGPRLMATGMETRQYLHGPMDAAGNTGHVVFGGAREALLIDQLAERSGDLVYVTGIGGGEPKVETLLSLRLPIDVTDGIRFAIGATFVAQRLTILAAELRGIDINEAAFVRLDTKTDRVDASA